MHMRGAREQSPRELVLVNAKYVHVLRSTCVQHVNNKHVHAHVQHVHVHVVHVHVAIVIIVQLVSL